MAAFIGKRLGLTIFTLIGVSLVVFTMVNIIPGDPIAGLVGSEATPAERAVFRKQFGFSDPLPVQYGRWLSRVARGDFGTSIGQRRKVTALVKPAVENTLVLAGISAVLALVGGTILGTFAAYQRGAWLDRVASGLGMIGVSIAPYWLGLLLILIFSVQLGWLPASGMYDPQKGQTLVEVLRHALLPAIAASCAAFGITTRNVRSAVAAVLNQDYIGVLRAKGLSSPRILVHVLRNAAPTLLTVIGLQVGYLIAGSVLVETVFSWPGLGRLTYTAIGQRDMAVIQACVLLVATAFVMSNLAVDVAQRLFDPRLH
ncbi:MAG: ABC transporter permease [Dehalococcoidia bacterium]